MPVDPAIAGLGGVIIGAIATIVTTRMTADANAKLARETREAERRDQISELVAEGYVAAVEAVQWLRPSTVEDSVDPKFEPELEPRPRERWTSFVMLRPRSPRLLPWEVRLASSTSRRILQWP